MARLASGNLLPFWRAGMGAGTETLKETLTLQCVDVNLHAANFVESFLPFDPWPRHHKEQPVHKFETPADLSRCLQERGDEEKLSKEEPPLSLAASDGMAELAMQLMRASERACRRFWRPTPLLAGHAKAAGRGRPGRAARQRRSGAGRGKIVGTAGVVTMRC